MIRAAKHLGKFLHKLEIAFPQENQMSRTHYVEKTKYLPVEDTLWVKSWKNI